jgi:DNA polymerase-3 subunit alpha
MDRLASGKKNHIAGQMSLMDLLNDDAKEEFEVTMPNVGEFTKEELLTMEKEVLGIYISGHPLESYMNTWKNNITATTADFMLDEETGKANVEDGTTQTIGGIINAKTIKYTKNDKTMAFLELEDLYGITEVVVFPKDYERNSQLLNEDAKVFVKGRVSLEEDKNGKLICERIIPFDEIGKKLWVRFDTMEQYSKANESLMNMLKESDGRDQVIIYVAEGKRKKVLPPEFNVKADDLLLEKLCDRFGKNNIKVV